MKGESLTMNSVLEENEFRNIFGTFRDIFGTDLAPPQNIVFNAMMNLNYVTFRLSRGGGKDFLLSAYALLYATSIAGGHVLIDAPAYRQVKILFEAINYFSLKNTYFKDIYLGNPATSRNDCYLRLKNGSTIKAVPNIPSYDGDIILVTEADGMPKQRLSELIKGAENNTLKKVFLMSGGYYDYNCMNEIETHECFSTLTFGYRAFPTGFYDQASIDNAKKTLSTDVFDMEYNSKICKSKTKGDDNG